MKYLLALLNLIALLGLALSVVLHLAGWIALLGGVSMGDAELRALAPWVMRLGFVGIPALILGATAAYHAGTRDVLKVVLAPCPRWIRIGRVVLLLYGFGFFVVFGMFWRHQAGPNEMHAALFGSSLGLAYFGTCVAALLSMLRTPRMLAARRCSKGHPAKGTDEVCADCGEPLEPRGP